MISCDRHLIFDANENEEHTILIKLIPKLCKSIIYVK